MATDTPSSVNKDKSRGKLKQKPIVLLILTTLLSGLPACQPPVTSTRQSIAVTYSILGSIVKELAGDQAIVTVPMPNGLDPHEWQPSAKDIETFTRADLIVENGLGLEEGMERMLKTARDRGVTFFTAADHFTVRRVAPGEGIPAGDPDQAAGAPDPHFWTDPLAMKSIIPALADALHREFGMDVAARAADLESRLETLHAEVSAIIAVLPPDRRKLVTGHESMGYFARRYGFKLVGIIIPGLSSQTAASAAGMAALKRAIQENQVGAIFTELGTSPAEARAIGTETGTRVVQLSTHVLPADGSYFTFIRNLANVVTDALK